MDDLRVENYEAEEVSRKKQKILKRVAFAGTAVGVVLSLFGLVVLGHLSGASRNTSTPLTSPNHQVVVREMPSLPGGGGAWFFSWTDIMSNWP